MSTRWPGGLINQTAPVPSGPYDNSTAPGVWTLEQQAYLKQQGLWPTFGNINPDAFIENLFQTWLYTGNGSTQTIVNGIDLAGKGGLVWSKDRSNVNYHSLEDTVRGAGIDLASNSTGGNFPGGGITAFNSNGYSIDSFSRWNQSGLNYVNWTFRKQPKFFDIVTYTGNGSVQNISHNLGSIPGMIIVKSTTLTSNWVTYHRKLNGGVNPEQYYLLLNDTRAENSNIFWDNTAPTSTQFTVGTNGGVNASGATYVAYLFAHNAGGFGTRGTDNVISCGSFNWSGDNPSVEVNLGYEPQFVLAKSVSAGTNWVIMDTMRGLGKGSSATSTSAGLNKTLYPNLNNAETTPNDSYLTSTGFSYFGPSGDVIYMAIRRPMKVPTDATTVFKPVVYTGNYSTDRTVACGFVADSVMFADRNATYWGLNTVFLDRLRGLVYSVSSSTNAQADATPYVNYLGQNGINIGNSGWNSAANGSNGYLDYFFSRRPGFFDVVCYTGTGSARTVAHNLGVTPEMMIIKKRSSTGDWFVYSATGIDTGKTYPYPRLNGSEDGWFGSVAINSTAPTSSVFTISSTLNTSTGTYIAYLFATCAGVSKVGSYTGTGATQTINCGFTGGARFVLIKRTDSTGDWYVWDTARGMVSGTDPKLALNSTAAETNANWVYTANTGFQIVTTDASVNASGGSYIFLAIA